MVNLYQMQTRIWFKKMEVVIMEEDYDPEEYESEEEVEYDG